MIGGSKGFFGGNGFTMGPSIGFFGGNGFTMGPSIGFFGGNGLTIGLSIGLMIGFLPGGSFGLIGLTIGLFGCVGNFGGSLPTLIGAEGSFPPGSLWIVPCETPLLVM